MQAFRDSGRESPPAPDPASAPWASFVGRGAELAQFQAAVKDRSARAIGLFGQDGIGKTALARVLAHRLSALYPDGQVVVDLQAAGQPLAPAAAMVHVVQAFHPLARWADDDAAALDMYRRVLRGRRVLLLLDNAAGDGQIGPLVPPAGCLMIVTANQGLHLPGLEALDLGGLLPAEATALLLAAAPRIGDQAERLARLCRHVPLALLLVGSALAAREHLDPAEFAQQMIAEQFRRVPSGDVDPVQVALALSLELLMPRQRRLAQSLSVMLADFELLAAGAVGSLTQGQAAQVLDELVRLSLVTFDSRLQRYRMHDVVRRTLSQQLKGGTREESQRRHAIYYAQVLVSANQLYAQGGAAMARGLRLFDLERANILAGQVWAAAHLRDEKNLARLASDYAATGTDILALRQPLADQLAWLEAAAEAARSLKDPKAECEHLVQLGSLLRQARRPARAAETFALALPLARASGDRSLEARTNWALGQAYQEMGDLASAVAALQACLAYELESGNPDAGPHAAEVEALRARLSKQGQT